MNTVSKNETLEKVYSQNLRLFSENKLISARKTKFG